MQEQKATVIGESILVTGNLSGDEDLTILGRVEGTISLSETLYVAESGVVKADVAVEDAVISGIVVGNVTATNSIQVTETGRLLGDLQAPRIIVVAGARVRGRVDMREQGAQGHKAAAESQAHAPASAQRNAHGRFARLSLPPRRPLAQPPQARTGEAAAPAPLRAGHAAKAVRPSHTPAARAAHAGHGNGPAGHGSAHEEVTASAPQGRRQVASHNKKRAQARRRD